MLLINKFNKGFYVPLTIYIFGKFIAFEDCIEELSDIG